MVKAWLLANMFSGMDDAEARADRVVAALADHDQTKTHSRHLCARACRDLGLTIVDLEEDDRLQDLVLTVHHAFMHTFGMTGAIKIIENHRGTATVSMQQLMFQHPFAPQPANADQQGMPAPTQVQMPQDPAPVARAAD